MFSIPISFIQKLNWYKILKFLEYKRNLNISILFFKRLLKKYSKEKEVNINKVVKEVIVILKDFYKFRGPLD